jgi:hypothetical protein
VWAAAVGVVGTRAVVAHVRFWPPHNRRSFFYAETLEHYRRHYCGDAVAISVLGILDLLRYGPIRQGASFKLLIHRTGNNLRFEMEATAATTSPSGTPVCDRAVVDATSHFRTWCSMFQAQDAWVPLEGNLNQLIAKIGPLYRFGSATIKLDP